VTRFFELFKGAAGLNPTLYYIYWQTHLTNEIDYSIILLLLITGEKKGRRTSWRSGENRSAARRSEDRIPNPPVVTLGCRGESRNAGTAKEGGSMPGFLPCSAPELAPENCCSLG